MKTTIIEKTCTKLREFDGEPTKKGETKTVCKTWCGSQVCRWVTRVIETRPASYSHGDPWATHNMAVKTILERN